MKKKMIERTEQASSYMTEEELLSEIAKLKKKDAVNIALDLDHWYDSSNLLWNYKTLETDQEYEARLKLEEGAKLEAQKVQEKKREKDRALYEKLKREFEP